MKDFWNQNCSQKRKKSFHTFQFVGQTGMTGTVTPIQILNLHPAHSLTVTLTQDPSLTLTQTLSKTLTLLQSLPVALSPTDKIKAQKIVIPPS